MLQKRIVTRAEWLIERKHHLEKEKELTRLRDELSRQRRSLPWVKIEKDYVFEGPNGPASLSDLFEGRSQLIVYHFMFGPDWSEGCPSCSFVSDHIDPTLIHLAHRDTTVRVVSRAPIERIEAFRKRMGWSFDWVSSLASDFNFDFNVSFAQDRAVDGKVSYNFTEFPIAPGMPDEGHGISVFYKDDDGSIYHTYSSYARGAELLVGTYNFLDLVPKGRDEDAFPFPMTWMRHHDRYDDYVLDPNGTYRQPAKLEHDCCAR